MIEYGESLSEAGGVRSDSSWSHTYDEITWKDAGALPTTGNTTIYTSLHDQDDEYRVYNLEDWSHGPEVSEAALRSQVAVRRVPHKLSYRLTDVALALAEKAVQALAEPIQLEVRPVTIAGSERIFADCKVLGEVDTRRLHEIGDILFDFLAGLSEDVAATVVLDLHQH